MSTASAVRARTRWTAALGRKPLFYAVTAAFLAFLLFALNEPMRFAYLAWTPGYEVFTHRVHHVMIGGLLTLLVVSIALQLYRPAERIGAYLFAAVAVASLLVVSVIGEGASALAELAIFAIPLVIIGLLHPGLRSFRPSRETLDARMLALGAVAAVPLIAFAALQMNLHMTLADDHVVFEHYLMMAGGALTIGLGAIVASFRPVGWRALVYAVAILVAFVGVASAMFPDPVQGVNFGVIGGSLAVLWAICFVAVAEYGVRARSLETEDGASTV
ncbi:hypothetical protein [Natronorarus salvus]|uniref:hypothetical protein n=1 Tax=Natronorarus salvus TaxID=3117733 RepID=UPI002F26402D